MIDYEITSQELLTDGLYEEYVSLVKSALSESEDEGLLAKLIGTIYERKISNGYWLIEAYVGRFPNSLHIIRVYLADLWAQQGKYDLASNEARIYLWMLRESGYLRLNLDNPILLEGLARAILLLTAVYTELGARSYSVRVLRHGLKYPLGINWKKSFLNEVDNLQVELGETSSKLLDDKWEHFFNTGEELDCLISLCSDKGFKYLGKRVELIADNFRFNPEWQLDMNEFFMLVHTADSNEFLLM